jgi:iron(III) transport system permease protein
VRGGRGMFRPQTLLPGLAVLIGVILVAGPFVATIVRSVVAEPAGSVSLQNFAALFSDQRFLAAVLNTLMTGTGATILSCVFALGLAWIVARTDAPGRKWFDTLNVVPFFLSPYVGAMSWIGLAAPNEGLLNHAVSLYLSGPDDFFNIYSLWGVTWVLSLFYTPYVYLFVGSSGNRVDESNGKCGLNPHGYWVFEVS